MIKKLVMTTVLTVACWAMLGLLAFVGLGVYGELASVQEDDATFNCYVMGHMTCGEASPWHGFVNEFRHADNR